MNRDDWAEDEKRRPWLTILLDTYETCDAVTSERLKRIPDIACHRGCSNCCKNPSVPFTEPELAGISWYVIEKMRSPTRETVKQRLYEHASRAECPFLVDDACTIYPVRPLICRQFYVKNQPCGEGEDILQTRPEDIAAPDRTVARVSGMRILEYWGMKTNHKKRAAFEGGFLLENSRQMHEYDWTIIAKEMDE